MPKVSILCSVYNNEKFLAEALESALAQTYKDFELVIYNDGSTDRSSEIAADFAQRDSRVRVITSDVNRGILAAINTPIQNAHGEFMVRLDSDDMYYPNFLEDAMKIQASGNYDQVIFGNAEFIDTERRKVNKPTIQHNSFSYCGPDCFELFFPRLLEARFRMWLRLIRMETILPTLMQSDKRYVSGDISVAAPLFAQTRRLAYINNTTPYYKYTLSHGIMHGNMRNRSPEYFGKLCETYRDVLLHWIIWFKQQGKLTQTNIKICCENCQLRDLAFRVRTSPPQVYEQNLAVFHKYFCEGNELLAGMNAIQYPQFVKELESLLPQQGNQPQAGK